MSLCSFSALDEIKCGCHGNISPNTNIVLSLCNSDITSHLQANHIPCSTIKTECDLIKARAGYYEENTSIDNYVICPNHRFQLGKRMEEKQALHGLCTSSKLLQKTQSFNKQLHFIATRLWNMETYKIVLPVGAGRYIFTLYILMLYVDP